MRRAAAGVSGFNPQNDITWHSLFWAEGTAFQSQGYSDTDSVTLWPNETGESDATQTTGSPAYNISNSLYNNKPTVDFSTNGMPTSNFSSAPTYPISTIVIANFGSTTNYRTLLDGNNSSHRNIFQTSSSGAAYRTYAGIAIEGGTPNTAPHLFRLGFDGSTSEDPLYVDEAKVTMSSTNAGSSQITGLTLSYGSGYNHGGAIALVGIYQGDITADTAWPDFTAWVTNHYGITIA